MFSHIFGEYLVDEGILSSSQLSKALEYMQTIRVKLGYIAVAEKLLTQEQVIEINLLQNTMDRRFGDIAVTKGDLTEEQLSYLLGLQGNEYLQFAQAVMELGYLSGNEFEQSISNFQKQFDYSEEQMESIKSGDVDRIADVLIDIPESLSRHLARLSLRNITRFISNHYYFGNSYAVNELSCDCLAYQWVKGEQKWFLGFGADEQGMLSIANLYSKEGYSSLDEEAIDEIEEFINCTNGLYLTKTRNKNLKERILFPTYTEHKNLTSEKEFYVVPIYVNGSKIHMIIGLNCDMKLI